MNGEIESESKRATPRRVQINVLLDKKARAAFKKKCIDDGLSMQEATVALIALYVKGQVPSNRVQQQARRF